MRIKRNIFKKFIIILDKMGLLSQGKGSIIITEYNYSPEHRLTLQTSPSMKRIFDNINKDDIASEIKIMSKYNDFFKNIKNDYDKSRPVDPYWNNGWIPPLDAMSIYAFLAEKNPRYYVECGSGNTTKFARRSVIDHNLRTKIISIDPCPRAEIDEISDDIFRIPFEKMDLNFFSTLTSDDILIIDNSHRSFQNSDVTVFFTEILPHLPSGMHFAVHDIFLLYDYPEDWIQQKRFYNEQYLLYCYIVGGAMGDQIFFPCMFISHDKYLKDVLQNSFGGLAETGGPTIGGGGFFWMVKAHQQG